MTRLCRIAARARWFAESVALAVLFRRGFPARPWGRA